MEKKLYRSKTEKKLAGVCGGIAKYLNIDVNVIRVIWAVVALCTVGTALLAYLICAIIFPEEPTDYIDA